MAKKAVTPEPEVIQEEKPKKEFVYARDHKKSMRQIATDVNEEVRKEKEPEIEPEQPKEEPKPEVEKPVEPETKEPSTEEIAEKAAKKAAEEAGAKFREELKAIEDSELSKQEKKKKEEELLSVWDREGRLPTDYREIFNEAQRIAEVRYKRFAEDQKEKERAEAESRKQAETEQREKQAKEQQEFETFLQSKVASEIEELKEAKYLSSKKEEEEFLKYGIDLNVKRVKEGLKPIDSVSKLYFMHYQPHKVATGSQNGQPAGANAPVFGAAGNSKSEAPTDRYVYARDHKRSFKQIALDGLSRLKGGK